MASWICAAFQQVDGVGPAFVHLEHRLALQAGGAQRGGGAARGHQLEAQIGETCAPRPPLPACRRSLTLMKTVPFSGSGVPALICAFRNASPKLIAHAHHFAGGAHFRAERRVHAGEFVEREDRRLDEDLRHRQSRPRCRSRNLFSLRPHISPTAILGSGTPVALLTYGTVREARGFTSST